jgi:hypothetical protein
MKKALNEENPAFGVSEITSHPLGVDHQAGYAGPKS